MEFQVKGEAGIQNVEYISDFSKWQGFKPSLYHTVLYKIIILFLDTS